MMGFQHKQQQRKSEHPIIVDNDDDDDLFCSELMEELCDLQQLIPFCRSSSSGAINCSATTTTTTATDQSPQFRLRKSSPSSSSSALSNSHSHHESAHSAALELDHIHPHQVHHQTQLSSSTDDEQPAENCSRTNHEVPPMSSATSKTTSRSKRIKWTQDLHERFVECVNYLGGAERATPRAILKLMDSNMLTLLHIKSHLQKYRTSKHIAEYTQKKSEERTITNDTPDRGLIQITEAMQIVNNRLHEQLEIQQKLQLMLEEQRKQLKMILDKQRNRQLTA